MMQLQFELRASRILRLSWVLLGFATLTACSSIEVGLGLRMRLDKTPVTDLSATLSPDPGLGPGKSGRLIITATTSDAKQLVTVGAGHGRVLFDSFTFTATTVAVSKKGVVSLPADPRVSEAATPHILITVVGHPEITTVLNIPIRYDLAFVADFSGKPGFRGLDGLNGLPGSSGTDGSNDPTNPSAGGRGGDGSNGEDGHDGDPGQPGAAVHVWMTLKSADHPLLQVRAASKTRAQFFLIDPNGGTLTVNAGGGSGGAGGSGGRGGQGGTGGNGFPPGSSGQNGQDGMDGHPGADGAAGRILLSVDSQALPYLNRLQLINKNGRGVPGVAPAIRVETIAPIW
jgi:hypothetical protein